MGQRIYSYRCVEGISNEYEAVYPNETQQQTKARHGPRSMCVYLSLVAIIIRHLCVMLECAMEFLGICCILALECTLLIVGLVELFLVIRLYLSEMIEIVTFGIHQAG